MKIGELKQQKLGRAFMQASLQALCQKDSTLQETLMNMDGLPANTMEWEFVKDAFTLTTEEMADKWYGGKDTIIGF
jgi:hypothetical protein